jgi:hypothetical protein
LLADDGDDEEGGERIKQEFSDLGEFEETSESIDDDSLPGEKGEDVDTTLAGCC